VSTAAILLVEWLLTSNTLHSNNNEINRIYTAPYCRNYRGTSGRSDQCSMKARVNKKVLSLQLKIEVSCQLIVSPELMVSQHTMHHESALIVSWTCCAAASKLKNTILSIPE